MQRAFQEETRNAARALVATVKLLRRGKLAPPDTRLREPRPKWTSICLALQLLCRKVSESMGNHDSKIVDWDSVD